MFEYLNQYSGEILLASTLLLGFVIRSFTAPYLTEKAKNTATKEDIAGITKKVEGIRTQLSEFSNFKATRRANQEKHLLSFHDAAVEMRKRSINPVRQDGVCFQEAGAAGEQFHGSSAS